MRMSNIGAGWMVLASSLALAGAAHSADMRDVKPMTGPVMPGPKTMATVAISPLIVRQIASAMSAAPSSISANATIVAMGSGGKMQVLRKGSNAYTCMPDDPASPGPDPKCADKNGFDWVVAWAQHKKPAAGKVGFIFMLAGGSDASNTDPYAGKPDAKHHWITTGPHVIVVGADASYYASYPTSDDPDTSVPYVMWAGTPYQHTMIPVK
jgi:hypothetical protein